MTASSREAAGIVWVSRHLDALIHKKATERALVKARVCAGKAKFHSLIGALAAIRMNPPAPLVLNFERCASATCIALFNS
jgi:hypothetical protein